VKSYETTASDSNLKWIANEIAAKTAGWILSELKYDGSLELQIHESSLSNHTFS
jgi:hypothetical protein